MDLKKAEEKNENFLNFFKKFFTVLLTGFAFFYFLI